MPTVNPFLAAVCAEPDEVVHRLVYADWLLENDQAERAEFIRAQIELEAIQPDDPRLPALVERERQLRKKLRPVLHQELGGTGRGAIFRGGFIEGLTLTVEDFLTQGERLFSRTPLRRVRLRGPGGLGALLRSPRLFRLRGLDLSRCSWVTDDIDRIANCPNLSNLRSLGLSFCGIGMEAMRALAASPFIRRLESLVLEGHRLGNDGVEILTGSPNFSRLQELNLGRPWTPLGERGARALASSPYLRRLTKLVLEGATPGVGGMQALASSPLLAGLCKLSLRRARLGAAETRALAANSLSQLRWLDLGENDFGNVGAVALTPLSLPSIRELHLAQNGIRVGGVRALRGWLPPAGLRTLNLNRNPVGSHGAKALAGAPQLATLRTLYLRDASIGPSGARDLAASEHLGGIEELNLKGNPLGADGERVVAARFGEALLGKQRKDSPGDEPT
jgi:uncharacterized protein (TIGR02996 family)